MRVTIETRLGAWTITLNRIPDTPEPPHPRGDVFTDTTRADPLPDPQPGDMDARRPIGFWKGPTE